VSSVEEDGGAGELDAGEESLGEFVVTRGDGPEMFERVEETLDEIAFAVEGEVARAQGFSVEFGGDDGGDRSIVEGAMKASASNALSAIKAPGSTVSISGSA
jgi:hypothetical protein